MAVEWTPDLSVGVNEIDNQHKELFKRVNGLLEAMRQGKAKEEIANVIRFLGDYVVKHFEAEESYMEKYSYPGTTSHKIQHSTFISEFSKLRNTLEDNTAISSLVLQTQSYLTNWLKMHIGGVDKNLGQFLAAKLEKKAA